MKHGKNPTVKQKKLMAEHGLRPETWLVERNTNEEIVFVSRTSNRRKIIKKRGVI